MSQPEWSEGPVGCPGTWSTRGEREGGAEETGEGRKDEKTKGEDECRGPPSSPVIGKEKIVLFLQLLKPRTRDVTEQSTWSPRGCSCRYFRWRMGTTLEWLSRRRRSSWPPFTPSWKASALESSRIPLSWDMQPPTCAINYSWCANWMRWRYQDLSPWPWISATLVLCYVTSSWRTSRDSRREKQRERCIESLLSLSVTSRADLPLSWTPDFPHLPSVEVSPLPSLPSTIHIVRLDFKNIGLYFKL